MMHTVFYVIFIAGVIVCLLNAVIRSIQRFRNRK